MRLQFQTKRINIEIGQRSEPPAIIKEAPVLEPAKSEAPAKDILTAEEQKTSGDYTNLSWDKMFLTGKDMNFLKGTSLPYKNILSVYKSIKAICDNAIQAQPVLMKDKTNEKVEDVRFDLLMSEPNERQSGLDFFQEWFGYYSLYGEGMILKVRSLGQEAGLQGALPAKIYNLNPSKAQPIIDYNTKTLVGWRYFGEIFSAEDIAHSKDFNPYDSFRGLSPLDPIDDEMQIDHSTLTYNNAFFKNDATPGLFLSTDQNLSEAQRAQLETWWNSRYRGDRNAFKPAILERGLKPVTITQTFKDMQFIEQKKLMREEIMGTWRVPKALFNITEDLNYATFMGQMRIFWIYTLIPMIKKLESTMNRGVTRGYKPGYHFAMDLSNVPAFAEDLKDKTTVAKDLNAIGFTADEVNEKLNLGFESKPWRRTWWVPFGLVPAEQAMEEPAEDPGAEPGGEPPADDDGGKTIKASTMRKTAILRSFLRRQGYMEAKMETAMKKYFYKMRQKALSTPAVDLAQGKTNIEWESQDSALDKIARPLLQASIEQGIDIARALLGTKKDLNDDVLAGRVNSYLQVRADKIVRINQTMKDKIQEALEEGIQAGEGITQEGDRILAISDAVKDKMREIFNSATVRVNLIARTETTGAVNGGSLLYYDHEGISQKEWITAHDEHVRASHRQCENQGAIPTKDKFTNGLAYPGDQSGGPEEVCNCRCTIAPVVE